MRSDRKFKAFARGGGVMGVAADGRYLRYDMWSALGEEGRTRWRREKVGLSSLGGLVGCA